MAASCAPVSCLTRACSLPALLDVLDSTDKDATLQEELNPVAAQLVACFEVRPCRSRHFILAWLRLTRRDSQGNSLMPRLLRHIIVKEIKGTSDHTTLFRSNSLSTKLMCAFSKKVCLALTDASPRHPAEMPPFFRLAPST